MTNLEALAIGLDWIAEACKPEEATNDEVSTETIDSILD